MKLKMKNKNKSLIFFWKNLIIQKKIIIANYQGSVKRIGPVSLNGWTRNRTYVRSGWPSKPDNIRTR